MSLGLEFYSVRWHDVSDVLGSREKRYFREIMSKTAKNLFEDLRAENRDDSREFELALERWIGGEVVGEPIDGRCLVTEIAESLAFSCIVRHTGRRIGILDHSQDSGQLFRNDFLHRHAKEALAAPYSLERLISRPLFGFESDDFPFWGGLTAAELEKLRPPLSRNAPEFPGDADIEGWFGQLWNALGAALDFDQDLITIYG